MRNLKRALSLVLAAAMLIGMMVVSASAVSYNDFSDRGEIVNKDAVSMLTTLEIIEGKPDGSYAPGENVDRAQMAKMISVMLSNNQNCDDLYMNVNSGLTDISANWAKGYINYCYTLGVIAGRGNGTFDPSANVTAVEAAKMLLTALGYEAEIEGLVGDDWALNTAALAHELGIFRNFDKDVSAPLNRDDAALLIYNAMDVEMIEQYQNGYALSYADHRTILSYVFGVIRVEGVVVGNEWAQLQQTDSDEALREGRTTLDNVIWYDSTTSNTRVEEGVKETEPVTFNVTTPVEYMGKAVTMYVEKTTILANSKVIGVATDDDSNVINFTAATEDAVKDYLKGTGVAVSEDTEYYVNYGYFKSEDAAIDWINDYYHGDDIADHFNLNGIEVQVIDNDDDGTAEYVLYLQETLSEVVRYNDRNETISFYTPDRDRDNNLKNSASTVTEELADVVYAKSVSLKGVVTTDALELEAEDLILYNQYGGRTYIYLPETVTGKMTRIDRDKNNELYITIDDGDPYYQSYIVDAACQVDVDLTRFIIDAPDVKDDAPGFDNTYEFILDSNGYIVAFRPAEDIVTNYALVLDSSWTQNALRRGGQVEILKADGTTSTYDINWKESAKAMADLDSIDGKAFPAAATNDSKLELYLGSRDVQAPGSNYKTGNATGTVITYSLNEAGDELTIESVLQGNTYKEKTPTTSLELYKTKAEESTAGVADNGDAIVLDGQPESDNLQYVATNGYDNGYGRIVVESTETGRTGTKTYAVDKNTVAFYYYDPEGDGKDVKYGVATGWDKMSDVDDGIDVQVYPVLEKTSNRTYKASDLAGVILFEADPETVAADYMLVLSANAIGKDMLELNVVFEDGTVEAIKIDDKGDFDEEVSKDYMKAWTYSENADGTYDIGTMAPKWGTADLLQVGTVDLNDGDYLALPDTANVWDVTEVDRAGDTADTGRFQKNIYVNTVIIVSEGQVRTAWVWDLDDDQTIGNGFNWNWTLTNYKDVYPFGSGWSQWQIMQALSDGKNVRVLGDLNLDGDLYIPEGLIVQVEGSLNDKGHSITGAGTLRVRNDFTTSSGAISVTTQVGDAEGDELILNTANTTISSKVGVYDNIQGGLNKLTVSANGNVYAGGDVLVKYLDVYGHLEAENYSIHQGVVYSNHTLVARGDINVYDADGNDGYLWIGGIWSGVTYTGTVELNGNIHGGGNLTVDNGTLTMTRSASIDAVDKVYVGLNGVIEQPNGVTHDLVATGAVDIDGTVSIPGTIVAASLNLGAKADVTLTKYPTCSITGMTSDNLTIVGGGSSTTTDGLALESLTVKGVDVRFKNNTATVELGTEQVNDKATFAYTTSLAGTTVTFTKGTNTVVGNDGTADFNQDAGAYTITLTKDGYTPVVYTITVTCKDLVKVTVNDDGANVSIKNNDEVIANEALTFTVSDTATKTVTKVEYQVGEGKKQELGTKAGTYTIPATDVKTGLKIEVTAGNAKIAANVTLKLADGKTALISGDAKSGYTVTTPTQVTGLYKDWLVIDTGADTTTETGVPGTDDVAQDVDGGKRVTFTFNGKDGGADQTITVTFLAADDSTKVAEDMKATKEAVNALEHSVKAQDVSASKVAEAIKTEVEKAVSSTWDTSKTVTVTVKPPYTPPTDGGLGVAEVEISIKLSSGEQSDTWTYTATYTVEKGTV